MKHSIKLQNVNMTADDFHNAVRRFITDCNKCEYCSLTEKEQRLLNDNKLEHNCKLHNKRILHQGYHPAIIPCVECDGLNFNNKNHDK